MKRRIDKNKDAKQKQYDKMVIRISSDCFEAN